MSFCFAVNVKYSLCSFVCAGRGRLFICQVFISEL